MAPVLTESSMRWRDGARSKKFPKVWREETTMEQDGYPKYRRRNNGRVIEKNGFAYDNRFVVPYNPGLSRKYIAHINVEVTTGVRAVKYIYKYIYKGEDRAMVQVGDTLVPVTVDEIERFVDSRYICAQQAVWRLLAFHMHEAFPPIMRLGYHLPDEQTVILDADADLEQLLNDPVSGRSMLTAFFDFCAAHPDVTSDITYADAPKSLTYIKGSGARSKWKIRQKGGTLGRMYFSRPSQGERFYLRMLLHVVKSLKSYEDLKRFGREEPWATVKEACVARGLLADDNELLICMTEAATFQTGSQYRQLFRAIICNHHEGNALELFNTHLFRSPMTCAGSSSACGQAKHPQLKR
jgi:hypothetical protein